MVRQLVIALILTSMVLHSASELGVLSYLYKQRHHIAYSLGLIEQKPITMCSISHDLDLFVTSSNQSNDALPLGVVFSSHEIELFYVAQITVSLTAPTVINEHVSAVVDQSYHSPSLSIFHPPC